MINYKKGVIMIKQKRNIGVLILALFIVLNQNPLACAMMLPSQDSYSPPSSWALNYVLDASFNGIGNICADSTGKYQENIKRSTFHSLVYSFLKKTLNSELNDTVNCNSDYTIEDICLYNLGIVKNLSYDKIACHLTRQEASVIMARTLNLVGVDTSVSNYNEFYDNDQISDWALDGINFCYNNGIIKGMTVNTFGPQNYLTYEQAIVLICRAGFKYGFLEKPPLYESTEIVAAESLPVVTTKSELEKYYSSDSVGNLANLPESMYRVEKFNKAIYIDENNNTNMYAPQYADLPNLCYDANTLNNGAVRWFILYDLSFNQDKQYFRCYQRGVKNNAISRVWLFIKDGSFEYTPNPFGFAYIGANSLNYGHTCALRLTSDSPNLSDLIGLGGDKYGTIPHYKEISYEDIEKIVIQFWDSTCLLISSPEVLTCFH